MKDIVIIGTGGLATEIKYLIDAINNKDLRWNLLGFIDDWGKQKGDEIIDGYKIIGTTDDLNQIDKEINVVIGVGFPERIKEISGLVNNPNVKFPNLIHPSVEMNSPHLIGHGNIITYGSFISCNVTIGNFNFFNTMCAVGHDTCIGSFNVFNPRAQISGSVHIGDENFWGMNSSIMQGKKVGNNNKIGASSFVIRNITDGQSVFGIPATKQ
jgi:sugar O-acyltransferase (sialic acid O-acetyltransferase NeuD family)